LEAMRAPAAAPKDEVVMVELAGGSFKSA